MPIYKVQAPNGKIYRVEGPENADQNALFQTANQLYEQDEAKRLRKEYGPGILGTLGEGAVRGAQQLGVTFGDILPAMAGKALGFEDYAKRQMEEAAQSQREIQAERPPIFDSYKEVESPYQALRFGAEVIGEQLANIATSLIPGAGGGVLAGRAALTSVGKSLAAQAAERGLAGEAATAFIAEGMKRAAPQIAAKASLGGDVGVFLGSYAQNAPEIFQNVFQETGQMDVGAAMLFGAGAAALDSVLPAQLMRQITGPLKVGIVEKVLEKSGMDRSLLRSTTSGLFKGVAGEGITEGAQEAISIAAENFVANNPQIFESKEWDRIMESSVRGAIAGGGFGVAGGTINRLRARAEEARVAAEKAEREQRLEEAAQLRREVAEAEQEIADLQARGTAQGELPGMETGIYTALVNPQKVVTKAEKGAKEALAGKQLPLFDAEGKLTKAAEKGATADQKRAANIARQQAQQQAAEQKANQEKLKKLLGAKQLTLPGMSEEEVAAAKQQQEAVQAQAAETGQGDLFGGMPAAKPTETVAEPTVVTPPSGIEGTIISPKKEGLAALGRQLGIGRTARILREDGPLAGKDLSDPAQAAEVKTILEAYASGKPAEGAAGKIEEFLKRPEFQVAETEVPSEPTAQFDTGAVEPSAPSDLGVGEQAGDLGAAGVTEPVSGGLDETGPAVGGAPVGEEVVEPALGLYDRLGLPEGPARENARHEAISLDDAKLLKKMIVKIVEDGLASGKTRQQIADQLEALTKGGIKPSDFDRIHNYLTERGVKEEEIVEPALGKKAKADVAKAEAATEGAVQAQADFVKENEQRASDLMNAALREESRRVGLGENVIPAESFVGTDAHNYLRLPALINRFFELTDLIAGPTQVDQDRAIKKRNQQELNVVRDAILQSGSDVAQFLDTLQQAPLKQRETVIAELNQQGRQATANLVREKVAETKAALEQEAAAEKEAELDKLADAFNEKFYKKTGKRLFLPIHRGPNLDNTGKELLRAGNLKGLIDHLRNATTSKPLKMILAKVKSLNLQTKIVIGPVEGNKAGSYDPATNTITINPDAMNEHTVLHELMHAAISHVLRNPNLPVTKQLTEMFSQLQNMLGAAYGAQDIQEFAAELVSNPEFQALLKEIKAPKSKNMFVRFMQTLAEFFGFAKGTNAYDKGLKLINDALDISSGVEPSVSGLLFLGTPNAASTGFGVVGRIGQAMPKLAGNTLENTKNFLSNTPRDLKSLAMGLLRLDNLNTIYGKQLPSIQRLLDGLERRNGMQEALIKRVNENYKFFTRTQQKFPKQFETMQDMAYDARLEMVDPKDANFLSTPGLSTTQRQNYQRFRAIYNSLPADVRKTYDMIRDDYTRAIDEYEMMLVGDPEKGIDGLVDRSVAAKLKAEFQARKRQVAYIPFLRRGEFWVEYDENGERAASAFESIRERNRFVKEVLEPKGIKSRMYQNIQSTSFQQGNLPPTSFIVRVMNDLNKQGASQEIKDNVYQSYLALFPAESISKNFMKSDNVRGMERDIVRGYGETMIKWSRKLANTKYTPEIDRAVLDIGNEAANVNDPEVTAAAQNITNQREFFHNPSYNGLTNAATTISYFTYIAGNISSAIVNLTTLPMFSWSILGAKFGFDKSSSALLNASKVTINYIFNNQVPSKYNKLFAELNDHAQLEHTVAREVLEGRRQTTSEFTGMKARIMDGLSKPFHKTEILNRGATAIAAYDLARGSGMNEQDAIRYALRTVKEINTSGLSSTAPKYMQHPLGRVVLTFKSFVWNSAFVVARAFHQAVKGETPAVRKEAFRQLIGIYGMAMAFAGIKGLPFMGATSVLATMINSLLGDDDEPYDFDVMMTQWTNELFYKGLVNYATNLEIADRVGVANDLIFRDDPRGVAQDGYVLTAMKQAFGPAGSFAVGVGNGAKLVGEGEVVRGIEAMLPSVARNAMKGWRYLNEGALTLRGDPVIEDVSTYNSIMQMIGFSPANLSLAYQQVSMKSQFQREILARRAQLLNKYDMARTSGDYELMSEVQADIQKFNARRIDPKARITPDTLRRSVKAREAAEKNMINGVRFNKNLMPEINALLEEED